MSTSKTVLCTKFKQELPALASPPYPGAKGQYIFENVSEKAWLEWQEHQTRLINEKQLKMSDPEARKFLMTQMDLFLSGGDFEQAEGYVPES